MSNIPAFGLGTFRLQGQVVIDAVRNALELGYRAIDTAQIYGNEAEVGEAIAASGVRREDLFLTTKIWVDNAARDKLAPSLEESLAYSVIPSSTRRENLASNLIARTLRLTDDDMAQIAALERNGREVSPQGLAPAWD
ncbi:aldo/keto reductase [Ralstonia mannitolilytica]|uniref:aldo/keto reductase n=1 Tax=Ralstonia mannitolilytica TaxID=105219 RepID=UPI003B844979